MGKVACCEVIVDFEEWANRELREVLESAGWRDAAQYRVQVLFNAAEPVCPTPQQRQRARMAAVEIAAAIGFPFGSLGVGAADGGTSDLAEAIQFELGLAAGGGCVGGPGVGSGDEGDDG